MKRSPELEALADNDEPVVADNTVRRKQLVGGAVLVLLGLLAGYLVLAGRQPPVRDMLDGDEEFTTTTFRPPSFVRESEPEPDPPVPEVVQIPPPPPPPPPAEEPDTTEFEVPPPPVPGAPPPPEAIEAPADEFPERYRSRLVVVDNASSGGQGSLTDSNGEGLTVAGEDRSSKFLAAASSIGDRSARARKIERIDAVVPEGTLIAGILETAIVSDLPGQVRAIVSQDVYSFDGRRILIPTGTRLIGEYQSEITRGQTRIFVVWTRMLRDDGVSVRLNSIGADSLGRAGLTGRVDKKFRERFGAAILLSIVGAGASYLTGYGSEAAAGDSDDAQNAEELARETLAQTFADMANQALGDSLRIPPTISVSQGERIFVFVRQDLDFSAMYEDPVTEALREIRRERNLD
ncbi:type IV secretion system protein VirB10 [Mesorhizobium australicum]|uniref:Type IV secretion system protein VirB10 n=1 Tax=Mesorhizobium australicum TaxID=536018 RepID=A0A1X7MPD8_9HYPH|nr:type IV secretion system protein VirB10 [Mesorhizobium australicum]SMH26565.1 type IV secretion system protein VirB10 [Mesorhizobium australicum]